MTDRQRDKETEKQRNRQAEKKRARGTGRETGRWTEAHGIIDSFRVTKQEYIYFMDTATLSSNCSTQLR